MKNAGVCLVLVFFLSCLILPAAVALDEPALPAGLGDIDSTASDEPTLPDGLGISDAEPAFEPSLPAGLFGEPGKGATVTDSTSSKDTPAPSLLANLHGFWELRSGIRLLDDPYEDKTSILEVRLQVEYEREMGDVQFSLTGDLLYDDVLADDELRLEEGRGWADLRVASFSFSPADDMDVKFGRQVLTWGTGDMLFINDLFPKDWNSFFTGRDDEYLKAPSDAVKISVYREAGNLDVVFTPRFDSDRFIDGSRISYWNGTLGRRSGTDVPVRTIKPDRWGDDHEIALRLYRNFTGAEWALYGYRGYWKSPGGQDAASGKVIFPDLTVYGVSYRGNLGKGIGNLEAGYYDSPADQGGDKPMVKNSEFRFLMGYEQELARNFTGAFQYYLEYMMDYGEYLGSLPAGARAAHEYRHVLTARLTRLMWDQNMTLSLFTYFSPTESDVYLRPKAHYKLDDHRALEMGGNIFAGDYDHTFFGQFHQNSNVYLAYRYSY